MCPCRTPLHCTVAYSNAEALTYLLTHGASLWLETGEEGETAEDLGERELAAQREEGDEAGQEATQHCLTLLQSESGLIQHTHTQDNVHKHILYVQ